MEEKLENALKNQPKMKLSKEELLKGKCEPDQDKIPDDPRFISPDERLKQLQSKQKQPSPTPILKGNSQFLDVVSPDPEAPNASKERVPDSKMMDAFREQHEKEIEQWKTYQKQVTDWKNKALLLINKLKKENEEKDALIDHLKNELGKIKF